LQLLVGLPPVLPEEPIMSRRKNAGAGSRAPAHGAEFETWSSNLDFRALAERYGTPAYVVHPPQLRRNFEAYLELVGNPIRIRYPVKTNPSPEILELLAALGSGADCAAEDEVWAALEAGIPMEGISYNSPAPDPELASWLLRMGATVVLDSHDSLRDLRSRLSRASFPGRLFVRISPGELPGYRTSEEIHRYTAHAAANSPFGIPSETLSEILADYPHPVSGVHMHVGTQMDNLEAFTAAMRFLHRTRDLLESTTSHRIRTINLGGGLGIPYLAGQRFPSIESLVRALQPLRHAELEYEVEPGNSLVGNAVGLLTQVLALKQIRQRRWAVVDVGTDQLVKITVARWEHEIMDAGHRLLPREGPDAIAGPLCFAGDVLLPSTVIDDVARRDPLMIVHAGAYCEAVSNRFNGRRGVAHVLVEADGSSRLVRRAEDPFFQPAAQSYRPSGLDPEQGLAGHEVLPGATVQALQSRYLHQAAAEDGYTILEAHRVGERVYQFRLAPSAAVDFIGWPLAIRMASDAVIVAVGHLLGWRAKAGPIYGTRLALSCGAELPARSPLECRIVVNALRRLPRRAPGYTGSARFELGSGECVGVVQVLVPVSRRPRRTRDEDAA
jgi:diaminopimelate decarboxylase